MKKSDWRFKNFSFVLELETWIEVYLENEKRWLCKYVLALIGFSFLIIVFCILFTSILSLFKRSLYPCICTDSFSFLVFQCSVYYITLILQHDLCFFQYMINLTWFLMTFLDIWFYFQRLQVSLLCSLQQLHWIGKMSLRSKTTSECSFKYILYFLW